MIFVNNPGVSSGRLGRCTGRRTFGTLSRNAQPYEYDDSEESDNFLLGCTVASFGVAITLALVLLPLSICCSFLIYHPLFIFGVVLFFSLTLIGGILCVCHPVMTRCWWYKEDFCTRISRQASYASRYIQILHAFLGTQYKHLSASLSLMCFSRKYCRKVEQGPLDLQYSSLSIILSLFFCTPCFALESPGCR